MPSRKSLIILLAFLFAAALPAVAQASKSIRGPGYRSHVPSGWKVKSTKENGGWRVVRVTPPGRSVRGRNSSIVVIGAISAKTLEKAAGRKLPRSDAELRPAARRRPARRAEHPAEPAAPDDELGRLARRHPGLPLCVERRSRHDADRDGRAPQPPHLPAAGRQRRHAVVHRQPGVEPGPRELALEVGLSPRGRGAWGGRRS